MSSFFIALTLLCVSAVPDAQAVSPPPDGGYPGGNTAEGASALFSLTSGGYNTAVGLFSLGSNTIGSFNTATGAGALFLNNSVDAAQAKENTATGAVALFSNTTGGFNTATGFQALVSNITGDRNTADGLQTLQNNTSGSANTAIGAYALQNSLGSFNIGIGWDGGLSVFEADHVIAIGTFGQNVSNSCYIGNIAGQTVGMGGSTCYVDNDGKLGVFLSARRFKTDIADMAAASEAILSLRPVTFHYKHELDKTRIPQFGLVAEEVAKVNPELVTHDAKGDIYTVRYEAVNVMLLNEFLKEHEKVEAQQSKIDNQQATITELKCTIAEQRKATESVTARLDEQAAQIQKVSAQLELSRPLRQTVLNKH